MFGSRKKMLYVMIELSK